MVADQRRLIDRDDLKPSTTALVLSRFVTAVHQREVVKNINFDVKIVLLNQYCRVILPKYRCADRLHIFSIQGVFR